MTSAYKRHKEHMRFMLGPRLPMEKFSVGRDAYVCAKCSRDFDHTDKVEDAGEYCYECQEWYCGDCVVDKAPPFRGEASMKWLEVVEIIEDTDACSPEKREASVREEYAKECGFTHKRVHTRCMRCTEDPDEKDWSVDELGTHALRLMDGPDKVKELLREEMRQKKKKAKTTA